MAHLFATLLSGVPAEAGHHLGGAIAPSWLEDPDWLAALSGAIGHFIHLHAALGLFFVIFAEEMGIPLPAPGDVAIAWGGYLTTTGNMTFPAALFAVVAGAEAGSFCLFLISRRFGYPFVHRFGRYLGLNGERLAVVERTFSRWGAWTIILGRHVPGLRIVISAFSGIFGVQTKVFLPSVLISATAWALIFLELGRALGRRSHQLFSLIPVYLLPWVLVLLVALAAVYMGLAHGWRPHKLVRRRRSGGEGVERR